MRIKKTALRRLIRESISELMSEESSLKQFRTYYQDKKGKERSFVVKARDKNEAEMAAMRKLRGTPNFYRFLFAKDLSEMTSSADVAGYDAPMGMVKRKKNP